MKRLVLILLCSLGLCAPVAQAATPFAAGIPAGDYSLDPAHASLTFDVNHMGFSHYTARFSQFDAHLKLDPAHPDQASLTATIDPLSLMLNAPPQGFHDELMGAQWLDAKAFPAITFVSTRIVMTAADTASVTGNLTLHGIVKPVTLTIRFNGGYPGMAVYDPHARVGFSAEGTFKRSDFGISFGIPAPGSTMGVSDDVHVEIEAEFTGPGLKSATK